MLLLGTAEIACVVQMSHSRRQNWSRAMTPTGGIDR
jgi:hypothetical protein